MVRGCGVLSSKRFCRRLAIVLLVFGGLLGSSASASASPIKHVVVIYMENHSFDNVLGYWCNANPGRCPQGGMPASVTLSDGSVVKPSVTPDTVTDVQHDVQAQVAAMNIQGGVPQMNGWQNIPNNGCSAGANCGCSAATNYQCISGYLASHVPNITALAKKFAISDDTFSMGDSPSFGGHLYAVMGSLDGFTGNNPLTAPGVAPGPGWGCDSDKVAAWISPTGKFERIPSCVPDFKLGLANGGAFEPTPAAYHATVFDQLDAAHLSWKIYGAASPAESSYIWSVCPSIAECHYTAQTKNLVEASHFETDASSGTLPAFSLVVAGGKNLTGASCHNKFSMTACDNYIGKLASAAENGPEWSSTAVFITFDDFGGFYDQVRPHTNPDGTQQGPRSPLIIMSPYARPGYTDTSASTFAGILAYTEHNFGLSAVSVNDAQAYDFSNAFNYSQTPLKAIPMRQRPLPPSARHISPNAAGDDPS